MFKNMKLSAKVALGFTILIVLAGVLGFIGWYSLANVSKRVVNADDANRMVKDSYKGRMEEKNFIIRKDKKYEENALKVVTDFHSESEKLLKRLKDVDDKKLVRNSDEKIYEWSEALKEYVSLEDQKDEAESKMLESARAAIEEMEKMRTEQKDLLYDEIARTTGIEKLKDRIIKGDDANRLNKFILECRRQEKNYVIRGDQEYIDKVEENVSDIIDLAKNLKKRFKRASNIEQTDLTISAVLEYKKAFDNFVELTGKQKTEEDIMIESARNVIALAEELREGQKGKMENMITLSNSLMIVLAIVSIILGVILAILITRSIVGPLSKVTDTLKNSSSQIALASNQLSSSSQEIANGATEQASSIEETTSSMEELASMVRQNAGNSKEASTLSEKASGASQTGYNQMEIMLESMTEINKGSDQIRKIIKVIDDIAFQTNILALNAAVEAARAGEAGMGFAVVADEVKNLANRSAEAAKETSGMIEDSIKKTEGGLEIATKLSEVFKEVLANVQKVTEMVKEVETASKQQDMGINQTNKAIIQLDEV
ncbi:MAG: chemotaxis protein, partial [Spirochaetes bacterium]|nr:chemotaxis protein [Spirochaetota bacterium]